VKGLQLSGTAESKSRPPERRVDPDGITAISKPLKHRTPLRSVIHLPRTGTPIRPRNPHSKEVSPVKSPNKCSKLIAV
jgi:hypothetical protein